MIKILTQAQKLQKIAELKVIPQQIIPSTLKYNLKLPNVKKIVVEYRPQCKDIGPTFQFLRKYIADIKYHNPGIQIQRLRSADGPIKLRLSLITKSSQQPIQIDPTSLKGIEGLRQQIERLGKEVV